MSDIVEFRHLEYLVAIAARRNFSKAAEHVYRSQPAVSHQIKVLEADIGFPLLVRNGREGVYPTPAGELVLRWARTVLSERREIFLIAKAIHAAWTVSGDTSSLRGEGQEALAYQLRFLEWPLHGPQGTE